MGWEQTGGQVWLGESRRRTARRGEIKARGLLLVLLDPPGWR